MTRALVVDASVALKWLATEPGSSEALQLLDEAMQDLVALSAPEHVLGEVGDGLRKRVAQGLMTPPDAVAAMHALLDVGLELVGGADRWHRTLPAALAWGVTTYDALYVQLAIDLGAEVVTADMRLVAAAAGLSLPVRPLTG